MQGDPCDVRHYNGLAGGQPFETQNKVNDKQHDDQVVPKNWGSF